QPDLGAVETGPHGHGEAQIVLGALDDIVIEAGLHGLHRDLLSAGCGEHDHGTVRAHLLDRANDVHAIRPFEIEVGDDDIERYIPQRVTKLTVIQRLDRLYVR